MRDKYKNQIYINYGINALKYDNEYAHKTMPLVDAGCLNLS